MKTYSKLLYAGILLFQTTILIQACAPVFSDLQSARTLGSGQVEMTPYYTNTGNDSESKGINHIGANIGIGLSQSVDIRAKVDHNWLSGEENSSTTVVGIGPKIALVPNRVSLMLPVGKAFGEDMEDTWQTQPTLFFTQPIIQDKLEFTVAPKYLLSLCEDCGGNFATNFGLSAGKDFRKLAWRAEYGRIFTSDGGVGQLSLGISFIINPKQ